MHFSFRRRPLLISLVYDSFMTPIYDSVLLLLCYCSLCFLVITLLVLHLSDFFDASQFRNEFAIRSAKWISHPAVTDKSESDSSESEASLYRIGVRGDIDTCA